MAKIPTSPDEIFEEFTLDFKSLFGEELTAIVLYGSGAKDGYVPGKSDINFLIVLSQTGIDNLDKVLELIPKWRKRNVAVPLFLTKNFIESALDTFPVEFLNLKSAYKLIYGEDVLKVLEINKHDLRLQIEKELRGKLIYLREGFLSAGHDRENLKEVLSGAITAFYSIFNGLIFLKDESLPITKSKVFERASELFGLQNHVFIQLLNVKKGQWQGSKVQLQEMSMSFISQVQKLVETIDKM